MTECIMKGFIMSGIINTIVSLLVAVFISGGVSNIAQETPSEALDDFFNGLVQGDPQVYGMYMDNSCMNFIANADVSPEDAATLQAAVFGGLKWEITDSASRERVAVCKVTVTNADLSSVLKSYEKESHDYVMENLYEEKVTDKEKLAGACLEIYLEQLQKASQGDKTIEKEIFIPLEADGFSGWRVILDDAVMKAISGGLVLPEDKN